MTARLAVIDTNVVVSGLLTANADAPTARILDAMVAGTIRFVLSADLLAEYRQVLLRPRIRRLHGLSEGEIDEVLTEIVQAALVLEPMGGTGSRSRSGDAHVRALVVARPDLVLVTGDRVLTRSLAPHVAVLSPAEFAAGWTR